VHVWLATDRLWVQMVGDEEAPVARAAIAGGASRATAPCFRERR